MFTNGNGTSKTFARFNTKEGFFQIKKGKGDDKTVETFSQVRDVTITKIDIQNDEYEGKPITYLRLHASGKDSEAIISFNMASGVTAKLVTLLSAADLSQPLGLSGQLLKAGTTPKGFNEPLRKDLVSISVFQNGWVRPAAELPEIQMVKVGNKDVADTSARDVMVQALVEELITKTSGVSHETAAPADEDEVPFVH
jgi:hypothetical protein